MKNVILLGFIFLVNILIFSSCKKEVVGSVTILGEWELTSQNIVSNGELAYDTTYDKKMPYIYQFNPDNSYTLKYLNEVIENGTYTIDSINLFQHFTSSGIETFGSYNYKITNNTLILFNQGHDISGDFTQTFIYTRP